MDIEQWPVEGFYIHYAPFDDDQEGQKKLVVHGASVRHAVLSHLIPGTSYKIRMQSFSAAGGESDFSNIVVKETQSKSNRSCYCNVMY